MRVIFAVLTALFFNAANMASLYLTAAYVYLGLPLEIVISRLWGG